MELSQERQAGDEIEITPEMIEAAEAVLWESGVGDLRVGLTYLGVVKSILITTLRAGGFSPRIS